MKKIVKPLPLQLNRMFRKWHRKLGVFAAFFIIFLSVTGVALNHTDTLSLAKQPIKNTLLLDYYGIALPQDVRFYQQGSVQVINNTVWLSGELLFESDTQIISVGQLLLKGNEEKAWVIVTRQSIVLYDLSGELIDVLGQESGVPNLIKAMSIDNNKVIIESATGYYQTDSDFFDWQAIQPVSQPNWLMPTLVSGDKKQQAEQAYRAQFLTLERIILDSHSGRILGDIGVIFMDFIALLLILLSISGLYIWFKQRQKPRK